MNPQRETPEPHSQPSQSTSRSSPRRNSKPTNKPRQSTIWNFVTKITNQQPTQPVLLIPEISQPENIAITNVTPAPTPVLRETPTNTQISEPATENQNPITHQRPLNPERQNVPWGDCWAMPQPTNLFCILSKNTGTINLRNLDMQAITNELNNF